MIENRPEIDLSFIITRECNKNCHYCYLQLSEERIEFAHFKARFLEVAERYTLTSVCLSGGEPLLHPMLPDMVTYIKRRSFCDIDISTNGLLLTEALLSRLRKDEPKLYITYDGREEVVLTNILRAQKHGFEINIYHFLTPKSLDVLQFLVKAVPFAKRLIFVYPTDVGKGNVDMPKPDEWFQLLGEVLPLVCNLGIQVFYEIAYRRRAEMSENAVVCPTGQDIVINTDGSVAPCCLLLDHQIRLEEAIARKRNPEECVFLSVNATDSEDFQRICPLYYHHVDGNRMVKPGFLERGATMEEKDHDRI